MSSPIDIPWQNRKSKLQRNYDYCRQMKQQLEDAHYRSPHDDYIRCKLLENNHQLVILRDQLKQEERRPRRRY